MMKLFICVDVFLIIIINYFQRAAAKKLEYFKLKSLYCFFPLPPDKQSIFVNIYAIVDSFNPACNRLVVWDDTCKDFNILLDNFDTKGLIFKPGQIVRIHRLELLRNFQCHVTNALFIVVSFVDNIIVM